MAVIYTVEEELKQTPVVITDELRDYIRVVATCEEYGHEKIVLFIDSHVAGDNPMKAAMLWLGRPKRHIEINRRPVTMSGQQVEFMLSLRDLFNCQVHVYPREADKLSDDEYYD